MNYRNAVNAGKVPAPKVDPWLAVRIQVANCHRIVNPRAYRDFINNQGAAINGDLAIVVSRGTI